jgi:F420-non-reducing hydrogenase iron-sulfur subunit
MCTGRIDLSFIIRAFSKAADGVIIGGCWPGECHYVTEGNYDALANMHLAKKLLARIGVKTERLSLEWVAASEGSRFAELMTAFSAKIRELGPLGRIEDLDADGLKLKLAAVSRLIPYLKLVERERLRPPIRTEAGINAFFEMGEANRIFDELIGDELVFSQILLLLEDGPLSTGQISEKLGLTSSAVAKQMKSSSTRGLVRYDQERGTFALARAAD